MSGERVQCTRPPLIQNQRETDERTNIINKNKSNAQRPWTFGPERSCHELTYFSYRHVPSGLFRLISKHRNVWVSDSLLLCTTVPTRKNIISNEQIKTLVRFVSDKKDTGECSFEIRQPWHRQCTSNLPLSDTKNSISCVFLCSASP